MTNSKTYRSQKVQSVQVEAMVAGREGQPAVMALLKRLSEGRKVRVVVEPSGTYGDAFRYACHCAGQAVERGSTAAPDALVCQGGTDVQRRLGNGTPNMLVGSFSTGLQASGCAKGPPRFTPHAPGSALPGRMRPKKWQKSRLVPLAGGVFIKRILVTPF